MASPPDPLLSVRDLAIEAAGSTGRRLVVDGVSFDIDRGKTLCIAGESGSGKSLTALSLTQLLPRPAVRVAAGTAIFRALSGTGADASGPKSRPGPGPVGRDLYRLSDEEIRRVRGRHIGMIFQEPMTSLNPVLTVGVQLTEAVAAHRAVGRAEALAEARRLLDQVHIPEAARRLGQYPFELSGGMRQRVTIAIALSQKPDLLIADEPTTALDVTVQAQILSLIRELQAETGTAVILITHDLGVVAEMADRVLVMNAGKEVESGDVREIFSAPAASYTKHLLETVPRLGVMAGTSLPRRAGPAGTRQVVAVNGLTVRFPLRGGMLGQPRRVLHAVEGISFQLHAHETLGLVGESGCGKSTTGKALLKLVDFAGDVSIDGVATGSLTPVQMKPVRRQIQMIFQDPFASLDPRMRIGELIAEPLRIHRLAAGSELTDRVAWLVQRVGLPIDVLDRYPHEFSGGQRQRIVIARALSLSPKVIVADECVSALDVSIRAQVLDLLQDIQNETGVAYLFISHDMAVVEQISHRVAVMYRGRFVETGSRAQIFEDPQHDYTRRLLAAVPIPDPLHRRDTIRSLPAEPPSSVYTSGHDPGPARYRDVGGGHLVLEDDRQFQ